MIHPALMAMAFGVLTAGSAAFVLAEGRRSDKVVLRLDEARLRASGRTGDVAAPRRPVLTQSVELLGALILKSPLMSEKARAQLEQTVVITGKDRATGVGLFVGTKLLLAIMLPVAAFLLVRLIHLSPMFRLVAVAAAFLVGLLGPDMIVGRLRKQHLSSVERGLADALDMMVICAEAGLALEAVITRVGVELAHAHPRLSDELALTSSELNVIADPRIGLTNMGTRTGVIGLVRLGATLTQSVRYGTPLGNALRTLSAELRQETLTRFEERAARLPVLLTLPMIVFILPCVFLIVAGPLVIQVMATFRH